MTKHYLPIGASEAGTRPPADIDDAAPFIYVDGNVMLLNEMITTTAGNVQGKDSNVRLLNEMITTTTAAGNVQDKDSTNVRRYTVKFKPYRFSLNWLQGNITDIACDHVTVDSEVGARYEITDISDKRIRLL